MPLVEAAGRRPRVFDGLREPADAAQGAHSGGTGGSGGSGGTGGSTEPGGGRGAGGGGGGGCGCGAGGGGVAGGAGGVARGGLWGFLAGARTARGRNEIFGALLGTAARSRVGVTAGASCRTTCLSVAAGTTVCRTCALLPAGKRTPRQARSEKTAVVTRKAFAPSCNAGRFVGKRWATYRRQPPRVAIGKPPFEGLSTAGSASLGQQNLREPRQPFSAAPRKVLRCVGNSQTPISPRGPARHPAFPLPGAPALRKEPA
jgi:hypothetical protein